MSHVVIEAMLYANANRELRDGYEMRIETAYATFKGPVSLMFNGTARSAKEYMDAGATLRKEFAVMVRSNDGVDFVSLDHIVAATPLPLT